MRTRGYVLIWKQILETSFFKDSYAVHLAIYLTLKANHADNKTVFNGEEIIIKRGQVLTGRHKLAKDLGITPSTVWRKCELLRKVGFLDIETNNRFSIITLTKYDTYQNPRYDGGQPSGQQMDNKRTTDGQQMDTPNKDKEVNELNTKTLTERFDRFWKAYPRKASKGQAEKVWNKIKPSEQLLAAMVAMIERAKTSEQWQEKKGKYIPHPATWLNAKGWEDEHGDTETEDDYRRIYRDAFGAGEGV